jgi:hypothetical protein
MIARLSLSLAGVAATDRALASSVNPPVIPNVVLVESFKNSLRLEFVMWLLSHDARNGFSPDCTRSCMDNYKRSKRPMTSFGSGFCIHRHSELYCHCAARLTRFARSVLRST